MSVAQLLSQIPDRNELIKIGTAKEVEDILARVIKEFRSDEGDDEPFIKAQDNGDEWKWFIELPFAVTEYVQHAVRDALAEKEFSLVHFNDFRDGYTRMSITIHKAGV